MPTTTGTLCLPFSPSAAVLLPNERTARKAAPLSQGHPSPHTPPEGLGAGTSTHVSSFGRLHRHGAGWMGGLGPGSEMAASSDPPTPPFTSAECPDAIPARTAQRTANCVTQGSYRKRRKTSDVTRAAHRKRRNARGVT